MGYVENIPDTKGNFRKCSELLIIYIILCNCSSLHYTLPQCTSIYNKNLLLNTLRLEEIYYF